MEPPSEILEPLPEGSRFRFACHKDVRCFTDCCRDLNLTLTPYDVLRVKKALSLESSAFLDQYTITDKDADWNIPVVRLRMEDTPLKPCPFVTEEGCSIYTDRPGACRANPLGRAARRSPQRFGVPVVQEKYFLVREPHCFGFQEDRKWKAAEWMDDQGLPIYNRMNDQWMAFLSRYKPGSRAALEPKQWQMFYMACYSLDRFRAFVFESRFLSLFEVPEETQGQIRESDEEMLAFAFNWLAIQSPE